MGGFEPPHVLHEGGRKIGRGNGFPLDHRTGGEIHPCADDLHNDPGLGPSVRGRHAHDRMDLAREHARIVVAALLGGDQGYRLAVRHVPGHRPHFAGLLVCDVLGGDVDQVDARPVAVEALALGVQAVHEHCHGLSVESAVFVAHEADEPAGDLADPAEQLVLVDVEAIVVLDSLRPQARGKPLEALLRGLAGEDERDRVGNGTLRLDLDRDDAPVPVDDRADELGGGLGLEGALRQGLPPPGDAMVNAAQLRCPVPGVEAPQFGSRRQTGRLDPHERRLHAGRLRDPRAVVRRIFGDAAQEAVGMQRADCTAHVDEGVRGSVEDVDGLVGREERILTRTLEEVDEVGDLRDVLGISGVHGQSEEMVESAVQIRFGLEFGYQLLVDDAHGDSLDV